MPNHSAQQPSDGLHGIVVTTTATNANRGPFANVAARLAAGALLTSTDVGIVCKQTDTGQYWMLTAVGSWQLVSGPRSVYTDSTSARTFSLTDAQALGLFTNASGAAATIPPNASVAFPIGAELEGAQLGAGQLSFVAGAGVTLSAPNGYLGTRVLNSAIRARKVATDTWLVSGDLASASFNGDFTSLLSGLTVRSYWQPDRLLVEDTTLRQTSGSTAVLTLSGIRSGAPTSIVVSCPTTGGARGTWQGVVTYIDGSTQSFTSAATVALTGKGAGLTLNIAAGTVATGNTWQACAATLTDPLSGNSLASDGPTNSPLITTGINGLAGVSTDGNTSGTWVHNNSVDLPAPSFTLLAVFRRLTVPGSNGIAFGGDTGFFGSIRSLSSGGIDMFNGSAVNVDAGPTANTWGFLIASFTNSTSDQIKFGSAAATTGANAGATNPATGRALGALINGSSASKNEYLWGAWFDGGVPANIAAIKSAITSWYGAGIPV